MRTQSSRCKHAILQKAQELSGYSYGFLGTIVFIAVLISAPTTARALGVRIPNQDAEAIARGNAFVATADNPSALYYNPAGISQLDGHNVQVGLLNYLGVTSRYVSPNGSKSKTDFENQSVPQIYYTFGPEVLPLTFGFGVYAPFGLGLEWPETTGFRTMAIEGQIQYMTLNPVIAWEPLPNLSLGVGPTFNYSKLNMRRGIALPIPGSDEFNFDGDDWAFGFNAGILWKPHTKWALGANYRSATTLDYVGTAETRSPLPFIPTGTSSSSAEFKFPQVVSAGISFRPTPKWNIEANIDWTDWNTLNTVTFKSTPVGDAMLPLNWCGSWFYEVGATYYFKNGYFASAGYFFSSNSTSERDFNPIVPDTDLHVGSIGGGFKGKHWRWALAGQIITGPYREVSHSTPNPISGQSANGQYQFFVPAVTFSVGYHF